MKPSLIYWLIKYCTLPNDLYNYLVYWFISIKMDSASSKPKYHMRFFSDNHVSATRKGLGNENDGNNKNNKKYNNYFFKLRYAWTYPQI